MVMYCLECARELTGSSMRFCNNQCQANNRYSVFVTKWKHGESEGTRNISRHIRRFLFQKYKSKCTICGWDEINPATGICPLEVDHIDGNSQNNSEENLRLICPNCHALTPNFRNLNKGNGREWRRVRYTRVTPP